MVEDPFSLIHEFRSKIEDATMSMSKTVALYDSFVKWYGSLSLNEQEFLSEVESCAELVTELNNYLGRLN